MTGFAVVRSERRGELVEMGIRAQNSKFLDLRISLPQSFAEIEPFIRDKMSQVVKRGRVEVYLRWEKKELPAKVIDVEKLKKIKKSLDEAFKAVGYSECPVNVLFEFKEFLLPHERSLPSSETLKLVKEKLFPRVLKKLDRARTQEGRAMEKALEELLRSLSGYIKEIVRESQRHLSKAKEAFFKSIEEINQVKDEEMKKKIAGEIAVMLTRYDVNEEIERLKAHVKAFKEAMKGTGSIGRELDFLVQEIHREANTIAAKSFTAELSHLSVKVRTTAQKMREILANVE